MKKKTKILILGGIVMLGFGGALIFSLFGLKESIAKLDESEMAKTPEAILASAKVADGVAVGVPVTYFDQKMDECVNMYDSAVRKALLMRQFEWSECGYRNRVVEQGMVDYYLGDSELPVAIGGELTSNKGVADMTRWFSEVEGKSKEFLGTLNLKYQGEGAVFSYENDRFYPLDEKDFSEGDATNKDNHNHLFTMKFEVPFTVLADGEEEFEIKADDDTFVFVGDRLAIDLGGIHEAAVGRIAINQAGEVYVSYGDAEGAYSGISVVPGEEETIRIFHADRDSAESVFGVRFGGMKLSIVNTKIASNGDGEGQIAYNSDDPLYVTPLGVSSVFTPDSTKSYAVLVVVQAAVAMAVAVVVILAARMIVKQVVNK